MEGFLEEEAFELGFAEWTCLEEAEMESCKEKVSQEREVQEAG